MTRTIAIAGHTNRATLLLATVLLGTLALGVAHVAPARAADEVYTVANYPVDARAENAVAAKERATSDGQQAAFRSLVKRLTPVTSYKALASVKSLPAANLISGISVRSERNSSTSYTATLDFSFEARRVRELLQQRGIPYVDQQAPETALVLVTLTRVGQGAPTPATGPSAQTWREAWSGLDLKHTLTPVKLHEPPPALTPAIIAGAATDPEAPLRAIATLSRTGQALIAVAEPDTAARRLHVTLSGTDAVGSFVLKRSWRLDPSDLAYTAELAAVVALGTLEGRWKSGRARGAAPPPPAAQLQPVQLLVEFRNIQDWQAMRQQISEVPGVADFVVGGLSARSAEVALRYPGGGEPLAAALATVGIDLRGSGGTWNARAAN